MIHHLRLAASLAFVIAPLSIAPFAHAADASSASDWPQFRGPGGQGVSPSGKPPVEWGPEKNVAWKTTLPGPGTSSPIVIGERIYITSHSGYAVSQQERGEMKELKRHVLCLDLPTGKTLWNTTIPAELPEQERIREDHGYASSTPVADARRVFVFFGRGGVLALDTEGKRLWTTSVGTGLNGWGSAASPVLYKDLVIVNASVESEAIVALRQDSGKEVWRAGGVHDAWNTPLVAVLPTGKAELVVPMMEQVLAFDPDSGAKLWSCSTGIGWYMCPSAVADAGVVYTIGGRTGGGLAIRAGGSGDVSKTRLVWQIKKGSNVSSPLHHDGHVYFAHENLGIAYCVNAQTGDVVYEQRLAPSPGMIYASPVLADGRIYYVARGGETIVLAAKPSFEQLARNALGEREVFNASPAVAGDRLLLRSDRRLYCLRAQ